MPFFGYALDRKHSLVLSGIFFLKVEKYVHSQYLSTTPMILFLVGIFEMMIITSWTKVVSDSKVVASGIVTLINIVIWYYVLQTVLADINDIQVILTYAFGCAIGTMISTAYFRRKEVSTRAQASLSVQSVMPTQD